MMAVLTQEEPILSRLDRLDNLMRHLEMIRGGNKSPKSTSSPSTPSSGTRTSDAHQSSLDFSPRSRDRLHCRPIDDVIVETEHKGTLLDRVALIEHRLLKVCMQLQLEQELEAEKQALTQKQEASPHKKKKGLKQLVKSCVKGKGDTHYK